MTRLAVGEPRLVARADDEVTTLAWSAAGTLVAGARSGAPVVAVVGRTDPPLLPDATWSGVSAVAWDGGGDHLATGTPEGVVTISLRHGRIAVDAGGPVHDLAWRDDLLGVAAGHHVSVHRADGRLVRSWPFRRHSVHACSWSHAGWLVVGGVAGVRAFDPRSAAHEPVWSAPAAGAVLAQRAHPRRDCVAVADLRGEVRLVEVGGDVDTVLSGYPDRVRLVAWCADGSAVAAEAGDEVTVWAVAPDGVASDRPVHLVRHDGGVRALAPAPGSPLVASGDDAGTVLVWHAHAATGIHRLDLDDEITALTWSPDGAVLAVGTRSGAVLTASPPPM